MYRDTTNKITVEHSETESTVTKEIESKTIDAKTPDGEKQNELLGFISWEYLILYLIYPILFVIGSFTPHAVQLWMDFILCLSFSIVCYIVESISNQWIVLLFFAFSHSMLHYIWQFLDDNGDFNGISVFPDTLCHALMFIYSVWFLGFGDLYDFIHFSKWKISNYFKIFWIICISGSLIHIVASSLVHVEDEIIHYKQALLILRYSSIFGGGISTGCFCSAAIVNPLNCKSRKMIEYHLISWIIIGIIAWLLWAFYLVDSIEIVLDHGWLQFLFIYPVIASLCTHFYHHFISNKQF